MNPEELKLFNTIPLSYGTIDERKKLTTILYEITGWLSLDSSSNLWSEFLDEKNENFFQILTESNSLIDCLSERWIESNPSSNNLLLFIDQIITRIKDIKILLNEKNKINSLSSTTASSLFSTSLFPSTSTPTSSSSSSSASSTTSTSSLLLSYNKNINLSQYSLSVSKGLYLIATVIQKFFSLLPLDEVKAQLNLIREWPYNYLESSSSSSFFSSSSTSSAPASSNNTFFRSPASFQSYSSSSSSSSIFASSSSTLNLKNPPHNLIETLFEEVVGLISFDSNDINELKFFSITFLIILFSTELDYIPSFFIQEEIPSFSGTGSTPPSGSSFFSRSSSSIFLDYFHIKGHQQLYSSLQSPSESSLYMNSFPVQIIKGLLHSICSTNSTLSSSNDYLNKISNNFIYKEIEYERNLLNSSSLSSTLSPSNNTSTSTSLLSSVTSSFSLWKGIFQVVFKNWTENQSLLPSSSSSSSQQTSSLSTTDSEISPSSPNSSLLPPSPSTSAGSTSISSILSSIASQWYYNGSKFPLLALNERACQLLLLFLYTKNNKKKNKPNTFINSYKEIFLFFTISSTESSSSSSSLSDSSSLSLLESGFQYLLQPTQSSPTSSSAIDSSSEHYSTFLMNNKDEEIEKEKLNYYKIFFNFQHLINNIISQFSLSSSTVTSATSISPSSLNTKLINSSYSSLSTLISSNSLPSTSTISSFLPSFYLSPSTLSFTNSNNSYSIFLFYYFLVQNYNAVNSIFNSSSDSSSSSTSPPLDKKIFLSLVNNLSLHINKMIQKAKMKSIKNEFNSILEKEKEKIKKNENHYITEENSTSSTTSTSFSQPSSSSSSSSSSSTSLPPITLDEVHDLNHLYILVISLFIFSTHNHEYLSSFYLTPYNVSLFPLHDNFFNNKNYNYNLFNPSSSSSSSVSPYSSSSYLFLDLLLYVLLKLFNFLIFYLNSDDYLTSNIIGLLHNLINFSSHFSSYLSEKLIKFLIILGKKIILNIENYEKKSKNNNSSTSNEDYSTSSLEDEQFFSSILHQRKILHSLLEFISYVLKNKKENIPLLYALIIDIEPFSKIFTSQTMKNFLNLEEELEEKKIDNNNEKLKKENLENEFSSANVFIEFILNEGNFYLKKLEMKEKEYRKKKRDGGITAEVMMQWLWQERVGRNDKFNHSETQDIIDLEEQTELLSPSSSSPVHDPKNFSPRYMYHETEDPEVFFLPCIWVQIVQKSPDIPWNYKKLKIF